MTASQAMTDITEAQAMDLDALALNVVSTPSEYTWQSDALSYLFAAANAAGFKLFFSFDMTSFGSPIDLIPLLQQYYSNEAYFTYNDLPFVSTFYGGNLQNGYSSPNAYWQAKYRDALADLNMPTYFVPSFSDSSSTSASNFFANYPVVDGNFDWDASWPWAGNGKVSVSNTGDATYITTGHAQGKTYMMGISSLQFKHIDSGQNWYRRGGLNLALRISQVLSLSPDFVEIQTWNDAGESNYIGSIWPQSISGTAIPTYTDGYDHSGWQVLMAPFITAYKSGVTDISKVVPTGGASVQGVFWHATLLTTATCGGDSLGKPSGSEDMDDVIEVAVLVAAGVNGITVNVYSGETMIASYDTVQGLNAWEVPGMKVGLQRVDVLAADGSVLLSATGIMSVVADSNNCNYNPQVVALV
ncbi:MAG: hypothetical protein M1818_000989 [Claussenomyces sp. TS43310]|nr:MAG: hypothetical protein M1818_000989 [Claussenomyces sp. TS43310]